MKICLYKKAIIHVRKFQITMGKQIVNGLTLKISINKNV